MTKFKTPRHLSIVSRMEHLHGHLQGHIDTIGIPNKRLGGLIIAIREYDKLADELDKILETNQQEN